MHKNTVFQPAPVKPEIRVLQLPGKHAKGRLPKKGIERVPGQQVAGAFAGKPASHKPIVTKPLRRTGVGGTPTNRTEKADFLAQSNAEACGKLNEAQLKRVYREWRENMTPEERAAARALKCLTPLAHDGAPKARKGQAVDVDFRDPADLPEAAVHRTAVDELEPQTAFSVIIENLDCAEITASADCFGSALTWAFDVPDQRDLVNIGNHALAVIYFLRPDLISVEMRLRFNVGYLASFADAVAVDTNRRFATGEIFGRVLEWVRRGRSLSEIGERRCQVAYVVRPTILGSPTLRQLGEVMNKTRQAKDKLAGCLRDTFSGIRAIAQRGEHTRDKCIAAHTRAA